MTSYICNVVLHRMLIIDFPRSLHLMVNTQPANGTVTLSFCYHIKKISISNLHSSLTRLNIKGVQKLYETLFIPTGISPIPRFHCISRLSGHTKQKDAGKVEKTWQEWCMDIYTYHTAARNQPTECRTKDGSQLQRLQCMYPGDITVYFCGKLKTRKADPKSVRQQFDCQSGRQIDTIKLQIQCFGVHGMFEKKPTDMSFQEHSVFPYKYQQS